MRNANNNLLNLRNLMMAFCLLCGLTLIGQAQTQDFQKIWTSVGSAGTVDETDMTKVFFDKSVVQMGKPLILQPTALVNEMAPVAQANAISLPTTSAVVRYNVTPVDGLFAMPPFGDAPSVEMTLRYLDTGSARVVAKLIEVDLASGAETVRLTFDSNAFAGSTGYHVNAVGDCNPRWRFDFVKKAYYVEATLTTSAIFVGSAAGISIIKIGHGGCFL